MVTRIKSILFNFLPYIAILWILSHVSAVRYTNIKKSYTIINPDGSHTEATGKSRGRLSSTDSSFVEAILRINAKGIPQNLYTLKKEMALID